MTGNFDLKAGLDENQKKVDVVEEKPIHSYNPKCFVCDSRALAFSGDQKPRCLEQKGVCISVDTHVRAVPG